MHEKVGILILKFCFKEKQTQNMEGITIKWVERKNTITISKKY